MEIIGVSNKNKEEPLQVVNYRRKINVWLMLLWILNQPKPKKENTCLVNESMNIELTIVNKNRDNKYLANNRKKSKGNKNSRKWKRTGESAR